MSKTAIGITGAEGFIGKHLVARCAREQGWQTLGAGREVLESDARLLEFVRKCDVIVHLAGANRSTTRQRRAFAMVYKGESCRRDEEAFARYLAASKAQQQSLA